jgi:hypothetical protein
VALKVTKVPEQIVLEVAAIETNGETLEVTTSVIPREEADVVDKHVGNDPPTVKPALITSPFEGI